MLRLESVSRRYHAEAGPVEALRGVDLSLEKGDYLVLEGPSGAGKTTLLHLAALLDIPDEGRVVFEGEDTRAMSEAARSARRLTKIGLVFQHHYLVPDLDVLENVALPRLALGRTDAVERSRSLLARVGLSHVERRLPRELSGGEQQRAGIARALVNDPALLIADEPTGDLDAKNADEIAALLEAAHRGGATLVVVSHDPARFGGATRRARLVAGKLV